MFTVILLFALLPSMTSWAPCLLNEALSFIKLHRPREVVLSGVNDTAAYSLVSQVELPALGTESQFINLTIMAGSQAS